MIMNRIIKLLLNSAVIAIAFHTSPDGDAIGSSLALMLGLKKLNKKVYLLSNDEISDDLNFLPGSSDVFLINDNIPNDIQCMIVLDCGDPNRINIKLDLSNKNFTTVNVDHHLSNTLYGDLNYVDTNASAVGEIVYQMLKLMGITIDKDMAACLYTSIVSDCGSFKYPSTTSITHSIAGDLINTGINFSEIHRVLYENKKYKKLKLYGKVLDDMELIKNKICVMYVTKDMLNNLGFIGNVDTSDIIALGMQVDCIDVAVLFKETDDGIKVSLRSKQFIDVRKIAESFGGGGHIRASGISMTNTSIEAARNSIISAIEKELI
jgi:bifunctional oligoribonuclease and PAP phosphatase NrnA